MNDANDRMIFFGVTAILALFFVVMVSMGASATTIYVPEGGNQTIQQAVNNASAYDTIVVRDAYTGTKENIDVNVSHLTIRSENGSLNCTVEALNSNDHVFNVTTDYVNITGFKVQNATGLGKAGIYLEGGDHCNISNNNVTNNVRGIYLLSSSNNNNLMGNTASNNGEGIRLLISNSNNLTGNNASGNTDSGIYLEVSSNNNLINNNASGNSNKGIYLYNHNNNNNLTNNTANSNNIGIHLEVSSNNNLTNNTANSNNIGIHLYSANNNTIYNNYFNNTDNFFILDSLNTWNTTKTSGVNIIGGPYLGGNFWANSSSTGFSQTCTDADHDGICDSSYSLASGNIDYLPLAIWSANPTPGIISWYNSKTNNNAASLTVDVSESVYFNATANQTITNWHWYKDDVYQNWNYDDITLSWSTAGSKTVKVKAANANGTSVDVTWSINVQAPSAKTIRSGSNPPRDSDGDGYSDIEELLAGTNPNDPNDYPYKPVTTPTATPAPTPTATPTPKPTPTPPVFTPTSPPPVGTPTPAPATPEPTPEEEPGFEAVFAIAGLLAVTYILRRGC